MWYRIKGYDKVTGNIRVFKCESERERKRGLRANTLYFPRKLRYKEYIRLKRNGASLEDLTIKDVICSRSVVPMLGRKYRMDSYIGVLFEVTESNRYKIITKDGQTVEADAERFALVRKDQQAYSSALQYRTINGIIEKILNVEND